MRTMPQDNTDVHAACASGWRAQRSSAQPLGNMKARFSHNNRILSRAVLFAVGFLILAAPRYAVSQALPDMIVSSFYYDATNGNFTAVLTNRGAATTPNAWIGVEFTVDGANWTWGGITESLAVGQSVTVSSTPIPPAIYGGGAHFIANGTHTIAAVVNPGNDFPESNTSNNILQQSIVIGAPRISAARAADFQNIWGTAGHAGSYSTSNLAADIQYTGIKQWRDGIGDASSGPYQVIASQGLKFIALPWYTSGTSADIPTIIGNLRTMADQGVLQAIEGFNEPIYNPITYQGQTSSKYPCTSNCTFVPVAQWQRDFYAAVKADPVLQNYPVYDATLLGAEWENDGLQFLTIPSGSGASFPAGTQFADYANEHVYPIWHGAAETVTENTDYIKQQLYSDTVSTWWTNYYSGYTQAQADALPKVITEFGFQVGTPNPGGHLVDQFTAGKNIVTGLLNAYVEGYQLAAVYTFYPWSGDTGWNIFAGPGQPLAAATYMHNLSVPISDTAANARTFTPGTLDYSLSGMPSTANSVLLEKSTGQFELVIWYNVTNWNMAAGTPITINPTNVTVNFGVPVTLVNVYDTTAGTSPIQTLTDPSSVTISLRDYAIVVEITK